jgi:hypothetical protein
MSIIKHLASVYVSVRAVSCTESCTGVIFVDPHVQTVCTFLEQIWFILCPREVFCDGKKYIAGAPAQASAALLKSSRPVVQVASPVGF